jgi:hypothetical protein
VICGDDRIQHSHATAWIMCLYVMFGDLGHWVLLFKSFAES